MGNGEITRERVSTPYPPHLQRVAGPHTFGHLTGPRDPPSRRSPEEKTEPLVRCKRRLHTATTAVTGLRKDMVQTPLPSLRPGGVEILSHRNKPDTSSLRKDPAEPDSSNALTVFLIQELHTRDSRSDTITPKAEEHTDTDQMRRQSAQRKSRI